MNNLEDSQNTEIETTFRRYGDLCAIYTDDGQQLRYETLLNTVKSFAARLRHEGVKVGSVIAPFAENPAIYHALSLAILRVGATFAIVPSVDAAIRHGLSIDIAITLPDAPSVLTQNISFDQSWFGFDGDDSIGPDGHCVISSSGTTGTPKYYLCDQARMKSWLDIAAKPPSMDGIMTLITLPTAGAYAYQLVTQVLAGGGTVIRGKATARETLEALTAYESVEIMSTPAMISDLVDAIEEGVEAPNNVKHIQLGGSPVTRQLATKVEAVFNCYMTNGFGSAEAGFCAVERPAIEPVEQGFVGHPLSGITFKIEDENGNELVTGEEGVLAVLPPPASHIVKALIGEYPYDAEGWFRSGDLGYIRADGALVLTGRSSELINSSGAKVAPATYEDMVLRMINATQVAAFGVPNALGSEDVGIAIVSSEAINLKDLKAKLTAKIGTHLDFHIFQCDHLPTNANGKIDRKQLLADFLA